MKKKIKLMILLLLTVIFFGFIFIWKYGGNYNIYLIPPSPKKYGEIALNKIDNLGLYTKSKAWEVKKQETMAEFDHAKTIDDTIKPLEDALKIACGKHGSIYQDNPDSNQFDVMMPTGKIENNVLILTVPTFTGDSDEGKRYAEIITENLYKATYKGIILDFRDNNGGDMGPMVTGLAPILPDGNLIGFIDKNNHDTKVSLKNGMVKNGGSSVSINNQKKITKVPIAILINGQTGSSAEITVLCFAGKHDIQLFGQPSAGYTSANSQVNLYDGRVMQITSAKIKDARGRVYDNQKIMPNVETNEPLDAALNWLNNN